MWHNKAKEIIDLALAKGLISKEDLPKFDTREHQGYSTTRIEKGLYFLRYLKENNLLTDQLIKNLEKEVDRKKETTSLKEINLANVQKANVLEDKFNENSACEKLDSSKVNKYQIIGLLGKGGMSKVYKAYDLYLRRFVVMKFTNNEKDQESIERLLLEARAQAKIEHPNVCKIYDVAKTKKRFFIVSQYVEGETLDEVQPKLSLTDKIELIIDVANALSTTHAHNIIHRDIKPRNIIVEKTDIGKWKPYLIDFGLAKELYQPYLTEYGSILGTPCYMSPEQASGESSKLDCRTDIYSLGATLYELLVDRPPFSGENALSILVKVINQEPVALREIDPSISAELERIVLKCLEKDPKNRYQSIQGLIRDLRQYLNLEKKITAFKESKKLLNQEKLLEKSNLPLYMRLITQAGLFICVLIVSFLLSSNQNNILSLLSIK
ncbi:MAG: serine/threonine-protein kinase [Blastocatellia bacterium]